MNLVIGKEKFQDIWIVLDNEDWEEENCPCCGQKLKEKQKQYTYVQGYYCKIHYCDETFYFQAEYYDEQKHKDVTVTVGRLYIPQQSYEESHPQHHIENLANFSIFDDHWWADCGDAMAFRTWEEAKKFCEEYNAQNEENS